MRRPALLRVSGQSASTTRFYSSSLSNAPIISIKNGTFYRHHPSSVPPSHDKNPPLFSNLEFSLPSTPDSQHWTIIGPSSSGKTTLLEILRGQHLSIPPTARSFPYLLSPEIEAKDHRLRFPGRAIQYVGFGGGQGAGLLSSGFAGAYLSARYESRRESTDFSLLKYLRGETDLNPPEEREGKDVEDDGLLSRVVSDLGLEKLLDMSLGNLSNGQTRRAKIARALLGRPEVLLLDEPFMGLDPQTLVMLSTRLERLAKTALPRLIIALRPQDPVPEWMTHVMFLRKDCQIGIQGPIDSTLKHLQDVVENGGGEDASLNQLKSDYGSHAKEIGQTLTSSGVRRTQKERDIYRRGGSRRPRADDNTIIYERLTQSQKEKYDKAKASYDRGARGENVLTHLGLNKAKTRKTIVEGEPLVELKGVHVAYGSKAVLGNFSSRTSATTVSPGLHMTIRRGSRWGIFGPNGSGKTTLLSLLTSDHPQTYSLPITHFSTPRIHSPGSPPPMSLFDLQRHIGHSSPEIHAFFPRNLTVRQTLESAFAETFRGRPRLTAELDKDIDAFLRWFEPELNPGYDPETYKELVLRAGQGTKYTDADHSTFSIDWADEVRFASLPLSSQRVALFLRAIVKRPDLIILDEALSGMDDFVRDKCLLFLAEGEDFAIHPVLPRQYEHLEALGPNPKFSDLFPSRNGERNEGGVVRKLATNRLAYQIFRPSRRFHGLEDKQALVVVSHVREEVPDCVRDWICLPDAEGLGLDDGAVRIGKLKAGLDVWEEGWDEIWSVTAPPAPAFRTPEKKS